MKVYEILEAKSDKYFYAYSSLGDLLYKGYNATCPSWVQNCRVEQYYDENGKTCVIWLY